MQQVEETKLEDLVKEAAAELLEEKRKTAKNSIKSQLLKIQGLSSEIKKAEREAKEKQVKLDKVLGRMKKIREGDWSVLQEVKK